MNELINFVFGRLSLDYLPKDIITQVTVVVITVLGIAAVVAMFKFKLWKWVWKNWITSLDAKKIGVMYLIVAGIMLIRGVADALMIRAQQVLGSGGSGGEFISSDTFQQVFSAHGTIMIFFVAMGLMFGLINLVLPLMLGARDVAFPFLNSVSFWLFTMGMILVNMSLIVGGFSIGGWLGYPPLTELAYSPGPGVDYWIWALQIAGIGSLLSGINFLVTILKHRAPGMTMMKMPIFAWSVLVMVLLVIFAFPILTATLGMLGLDRLMGMHFFTSDFGGNPMMYINLIWAWGHPEVYILVLPAFGIFSEIVATYSRKKLFGYKTMVVALFAITFLSFTVWLHHFFTMGSGANVNAFFGITTMIIAIPTGVKIFNWLFTMYRGRISFKSPMLWFLAFVITFTIGGVTGVLLAVPGIDFQVHNSLFLVAHFHNVIIGGVVFGYLAAITYWFPKIFGFKLNERFGRYAAYCWTIGFMVAFLPLYALGFMGATRRLDHYDASTGWQVLFVVAGIGVLIIALGIFFQILQLVVSIWQRKKNLDLTGDPWNGRTLEWSVPSPAPFYNFAVTPVVTSRDPFWEEKQRLKISGEKSAKPEYKDIYLPKDSGMGIIIAGFGFLVCFGLIWHMWWLAVVGLIGAIVCIIIKTGDDDNEYKITAAEIELLDISNRRKKAAL
ncbi:MAG TPA: cytochrome o ubiquinol oxidase subunit I [Candidatus Saccharibacteria bacterium]|nr:cytochrome o ubiquinol oxidase subunit I [Candidatus Saccharibacteria bacterium]HRQ06609.1 cytochrome o ubiquinol oxidase subunit I [Candidatus Saccharibacteria bacterium]